MQMEIVRLEEEGGEYSVHIIALPSTRHSMMHGTMSRLLMMHGTMSTLLMTCQAMKELKCKTGTKQRNKINNERYNTRQFDDKQNEH